jgi:hypothetical protein
MAEYGSEQVGIVPMNEQINVGLAQQSFGKEVVAFPMTVPYFAAVQVFNEISNLG